MIGNEEIDMKKYVKPELFYEQFELSKHIAACAMDFVGDNKGNVDECYVIPEGGEDLGRAFNTAKEGSPCDYTPDDFCYENASPNSSTFNS